MPTLQCPKALWHGRPTEDADSTVIYSAYFLPTLEASRWASSAMAF